ncbi:hypothetical protein BCR43DRAFT_499790 [Syncephalastrum racemosum]|uniref:Uncharacterized protein n=1 Tax=Syncephalastrum racemosum TaxID=13706 RepID=A0A1X2GZN0_SYNRA|nr:hypothetical protein BCR43DRAFT_499790 [Syncephalastrum racemosum]
MDYFPSPPSSPILGADKVVCGSCDKALNNDWFCVDCHEKCDSCNRFLSHGEHCSRCWSFDALQNLYVRKPIPTGGYHPYRYQQRMPSASSSTSTTSSACSSSSIY